MFSLKKLGPRVYSLRVDSRYDLCMMFLRYEEFYESPNPRFAGNKFTLAEYMSWYASEQGSGEFTYVSDWSGFNMPLDTVKKCHDLGIPDPNMYDSLMIGIYQMISCRETDAYIIGSTPESDASEHEITHAFYYVNEQYREKANRTISSFSTSLYARLGNVLSEEGYAERVYYDEINAYASESKPCYMFEDFNGDKEYKELRKRLLELRNKHIDKNYCVD